MEKKIFAVINPMSTEWYKTEDSRNSTMGFNRGNAEFFMVKMTMTGQLYICRLHLLWSERKD